MIAALKIPKAGGLLQGSGDVRHLTESDANSALAISQSTRQLAERDNIIAAVVNLLISRVNNYEQVVDLTVPKTYLGPSQSVVILNFRIPNGYEARLLNAVVDSLPASKARLDVFWSESYGASTGTSVASTLTETSGQTQFFGEGELVIKVTNLSSSGIEVVGDVHVTMRPVAEVGGSLLVPTNLVNGASGTSGQSGPTGSSGSSGARGASGFSGISGTSGAAGNPAYSTVSAPGFTMPAIDTTAPYTTATVTVSSTAWLIVDEIIYVGTAGHMRVDEILSATSVKLSNPGYTGNATGGSSIAAGVGVAPSGIKGADGTSSSGSITQQSFSAAYTWSGATGAGPSEGYTQPAASGNFTISETTIATGSGTAKILQGQLRLLLNNGNLTITFPGSGAGSTFTTSNTLIDATVDESTVAGGQPVKIATSASVWTIRMPAAYSAGAVKVTLSYFGLVLS